MADIAAYWGPRVAGLCLVALLASCSSAWPGAAARWPLLGRQLSEGYVGSLGRAVFRQNPGAISIHTLVTYQLLWTNSQVECMRS